MSIENPSYFLSSVDEPFVLGDNNSFFVPQHEALLDNGIPATGGSPGEAGVADALTFHSGDLSIDSAEPSISHDAFEDFTASVASDEGYGAGPTTYTGYESSDHADWFNTHGNEASTDQSQNLLSGPLNDGFEGNSSNGEWVGNALQSQHSQTFDLAVGAGPSVVLDAFVGFLDAKGGNGGTHGGGGGGGGSHGGGSGGGLLTSYTSGDSTVSDANEFNIHIDFGGSWTSQEQAIVTWAADLWSHIITGDVRDDTDLNGNLVDDVNISMNIGRIDGSGNPITGDILAQTQITAVRDPGSIDQWLPVTSQITLDSTDLKNSINQGWSGTWDTIVAHEMGHALGFAGVIFENLGLVDSFGNFIGANAVADYGAGATSVPLEQDGGSGTAGSHWDETTFAPNGVQMSNELMTGYVVQNEQTYLSDTTVGAMADLGYQVQDPSAGSDHLVIDNHLLLA